MRVAERRLLLLSHHLHDHRLGYGDHHGRRGRIAHPHREEGRDEHEAHHQPNIDQQT